MTVSDSDLDPYQDKVPKIVRTVAYWVAFIWAAACILLLGLTNIYWPELTEQVRQTTNVVSEAILFITGGLGVVYRPTKA